ncbi:HK97 gp10 family phage protein [Sporohalobacter salinus]|uniref:HK97 gp10 family phage protein n=1 Tax=Sporohalobacter salinus TaxID=1494606 RepID=UPI0019606D0F|nr:HK97 gp10 family phage protein [Sporohalobacter salinus]MBM7623721.1 hypothetical protein [Sporohalobacter salinus]
MSDEIKVDTSELEELARRVPEALGIAQNYAGADLEGNLQENSPVDQGHLQGSWHRETVGQYGQLIYSSADYALVASEGSDPYEIYPDESKALYFEYKGSMVTVKKVEHPGIEGTGYIPESIKQTEDRIDEFVDKALEEVDIV